MGVRIDLAPLTTLCLALLSSEELASASLEGYQRDRTYKNERKSALSHFKIWLVFSKTPAYGKGSALAGRYAGIGGKCYSCR